MSASLVPKLFNIKNIRLQNVLTTSSAISTKNTGKKRNNVHLSLTMNYDTGRVHRLKSQTQSTGELQINITITACRFCNYCITKLGFFSHEPRVITNHGWSSCHGGET